ncbi:MAG: imidazole glycerol phosphate synthase subunit HisH [Clostridia bacterium]|nr:imidazole glycerol phosphate synthase subunit HisH [Clostridia bacterium]
MVAVIDYGVGNLFSLRYSLEKLGADVVVTGDRADIESADRVILPGVGAFRDARRKLRDTGLDKVVCALAAQGKPMLGICLGMQLLFEKSYEFGEYDGLGLLRGSVRPLQGVVPADYKIPQIGWNALRFRRESSLFRHIKDGDYVYFVHSYYAADCADSLIADCDYGVPVTAAVQKENVFGCQFHPEKSGDVGLAILRAFCFEEAAV